MGMIVAYVVFTVGVLGLVLLSLRRPRHLKPVGRVVRASRAEVIDFDSASLALVMRRVLKEEQSRQLQQSKKEMKK